MKPPNTIQFEITSQCNVQCKICDWGRMPDYPMIDWGQFERILPAVTPGSLVSLFGAGEPLLHPQLLDMIRAAFARGARSQISTNGVLLTPEFSQALKTAGLSLVIVSIHGATKETHERLQPGVDSDAIWSNVAACVAAGIETEIAFVPLRSNIHEVGMLVKRARECGIRAVRFLRFLCPATKPEVADEDPFTPELLEQNAAILHRAIAEGRVAGMEVTDYVGV